MILYLGSGVREVDIKAGKVITSGKNCGMQLLVPTRDTCSWYHTPDMWVYSSTVQMLIQYTVITTVFTYLEWPWAYTVCPINHVYSFVAFSFFCNRQYWVVSCMRCTHILQDTFSGTGTIVRLKFTKISIFCKTKIVSTFSYLARNHLFKQFRFGE